MSEERYKYRVELSFQVDVIAGEEVDAEQVVYDAFLRGEYNVGPNGERIADHYTQVVEVLDIEEGDE